jgi:hypothetical protein
MQRIATRLIATSVAVSVVVDALVDKADDEWLPWLLIVVVALLPRKSSHIDESVVVIVQSSSTNVSLPTASLVLSSSKIACNECNCANRITLRRCGVVPNAIIVVLASNSTGTNANNTYSWHCVN